MNKPTPQELFSTLSSRQKEVLRLVCQGTAYKEIAELLIVTESTVKSHMRVVYDKLDLFHLNRDDRIYKIRSIYCPMFEEKPEDIPELVRIQKKLLDSAAKIIQKDGIIVYSTCTILPEENAEIVQYFMNTYSNFIIENASQFVPEEVVSADGFVETWPDKHGIDGSFAVRFRKVK